MLCFFDLSGTVVCVMGAQAEQSLPEEGRGGSKACLVMAPQGQR